MQRLVLLLFLLSPLLLTTLTSTATAGKLDDVRKAVNNDASGSNNASTSSASTHYDQDYDGDSGTSGGADYPPELICLAVPAMLFCVPYFALEGFPSDDNERGATYFNAYPYASSGAGLLRFVSEANTGSPEEQSAARAALVAEENLSRISLRFALEYGLDFGMVHQPAAEFSLHSSSRFGFSTRWTQLLENSHGTIDHLGMSVTQIIFRFAQAEQLQFQTGVGLRLLVDGHDLTPGFNFSYGVDIQPGDPILVHAAIEIGNLGDAFLFGARSTFGVMLPPCEVFLGLDVLLINPVLFIGPVAGVRAWF